MKQKAIIFISGGFGNVLFQFIAASYIKEFKSQKVYINTLLVNENFITKNILNWKIHPFIGEKLFTNNFDNTNKIYLFGLFKLFLSRLLKTPFLNSVYQRTNFSVFYSEHKFMLGYYQNLKFYDKKWFNLKLSEIASILEINQPVDRIAVHYRGTDSVWGKTNSNYYKIIFHEIKTLNKKIYFVTDDKKKCLEIIKKYEITNYSFYSSSIKDDFKFLTETQTIFCSPSTFSWWSSIINSDSKNITMPLYFKNRFSIEKNIRFL